LVVLVADVVAMAMPAVLHASAMVIEMKRLLRMATLPPGTGAEGSTPKSARVNHL
jgi:hypothetical protein